MLLWQDGLLSIQHLIEHPRTQILKLGQDPQPLDQGQFTAAAFFLATISIQIRPKESQNNGGKISALAENFLELSSDFDLTNEHLQTLQTRDGTRNSLAKPSLIQ